MITYCYPYVFSLFFCVSYLSTFGQNNSVNDGSAPQNGYAIQYEKFTLDNGLEVILHQDDSDPIVAVATLMHVGSNREKPGKTGFAHFFEHMSFNDSENTPVGANRKLIPEWGGERNGGTWSDGTIYYEVVPKDAFDKILWIDSDRYGYMINTVTKEALEREKQVVKNEKRQRVDNNPYGYSGEIMRKNLYPEGHPYSWTVIGSLPDLQSATLDDVKEFYEQYYGANNGTLVIAGDIDIEETKEKVQRWFGEIREGEKVAALPAMPVTLKESKSLYFEDNFAKLPQLRITFPTVEDYHKDMYALEILADLLGGSKKSPLYKEIVENKKLAPQLYSYQRSDELAGEFNFIVRTKANKDLDSVHAAIQKGLQNFEKNGFTDNELKRVKAELETELFQGFSTVLNKAFQLAQDNEFNGDPGYITKAAALYNEVSREDIMRVYETYIKGKNKVMLSMVPKGQIDLAVSGSKQASVWIEEVKKDVASEEVSQGKEAVYDKTPSKYDRSEPEFGELPLLKAPEVWKTKLSNGLEVLGIENNELPLVQFDITIPGGHLSDPIDKSGLTNLMARMMMEGTTSKTAAELEEAIGLLGASVDINCNPEEIRILVSCLSKNMKEIVSVLTDILLNPRWDQKEFERIREEVKTRIKDRKSNPRAVSSTTINKLLYNDSFILSSPISGTLKTLNNISLEDLKNQYKKLIPVKNSVIHIAGNITEKQVVITFSDVAKQWKLENDAMDYKREEVSNPKITKDTLYFIDVPGAKQSVLQIGRLALSGDNPMYNNLVYANEVLGGGSSGQLFQTLRIEKGYTYGAYSRIPQRKTIAPYTISTSVRANATFPSLEIIKEMVDSYGNEFDKEKAEITKAKILKSSTRDYEGLNDKLNILREISKFNKSDDFIEKEQKELLEMSVEDFKKVINTYIIEDEMLYLVVGDKETQWEEVKKLGKPVRELDIDGNLK